MIKVVIVDDEPRAITLIRSYLEHFANFELKDSFRNGLKALEYLNKNQVDVIFLDINMPHLNGLSLSKMVARETAIVFTTAYSEHAVESYSVDALDYLLKPITLERFSKTIIKITQRFDQEDLQTEKDNSSGVIFIKSGAEKHQLKMEELNYLKKDGNYMHYVASNKKIMTRESISEALEKLPKDFIQVQKSYIVNFNKIESVSPDFISVGGSKIPIGSKYRHALNSRIG